MGFLYMMAHVAQVVRSAFNIGSRKRLVFGGVLTEVPDCEPNGRTPMKHPSTLGSVMSWKLRVLTISQEIVMAPTPGKEFAISR